MDTDIPWLIDNTRTRRWYYRDEPPTGSIIRYMDESYIDTVARVTFWHVHLTSGRTMIRPYIGSRIAVWILTAKNAPKRSRTSWNASTRLPPNRAVFTV